MKSNNIMILKYCFLGAFLLISAGFAAYHYFILEPMKKCEAEGKWWNSDQNRCYLPLDITVLTGRAPEKSDAKSSATSKN